jgi:hypothetical protein
LDCKLQRGCLFRSCTDGYSKSWVFLVELYGLSCCAYDIGNAFLYRKTKEKVYITAGPEFGANFHHKKLIIDKSLYGLKTSAARFHEYLSE